MTATVAPDATGTLVNTASLTVPGGVTDPDIRNNSATDTDTLTPRADLELTKTNGAATSVPGQGVTYTIVATNNGPSAVTGATVVDTFAATVTGVAWTCTASTGSTCPARGTGNISTVVDLAVGGTATFTATGTITPDATGTLANTASITVPGGVTDPNPGNDSATDSDSLTPEADLALTKTDRVTEVFQGGLTTYTIVVTNQGPSDVTGASLSDPLPPDLVDFNWTCTASAGSRCPASGTGAITATVDLLQNGTATFTVLATVSPAASGTIRNQATVSVPRGTTDPVTSNDTARDTNTVNPTADIVVIKTVDNATPDVGDTVTFTVTVRNQGPAEATGVQISDGVPAGLTLLTPAPSQGTYTQATGVWDVGTLSNGARETLTLTMRVEQAGLLTNVATKIAGDQFDPDTSNNTSGVSLTGRPSADIQVHKTVDNVLPNTGRQVTFTVTVTNAGPSGATDVRVTDMLPAGLTLLTATPSQGTYTAATGVWNIGDVAVNANVALTLAATVDQAGVLTNTATKTAQGENDPAASNDASGVTVNGQSADVQVVKTVDNTEPLLSDTITFTITVSNNGPGAATGVEILDQLPSGLTFINATASQGTYRAATGIWTVGSLASSGAGATATLQLAAQVTQSVAIVNSAIKTAQDQPDPNPANDQGIVSTVGQPRADVTITKTNRTTSVVPGEPLTYTIVVTNNGPSRVTDATVVDTVPATLTEVSWTCTASAGSNCAATGTGDILTTVDLVDSGTATFTLTATVRAGATGTLTNTAQVAVPAGVTDPSPGNNSATDSDTVTPQADLIMSKTDGVTSVIPGQSLTYTIVVTNAGPSRVTGATVADTVPAALSGATWTCTASAGSSCAATGTGDILTTVDLAANGTATFALSGTVIAGATGRLVNTATVTAPAGVDDPDTDNNSATDSNTLAPQADLTLTKTDNATATVPGTTVTYTLVATNAGPSAVVGATVTDTVPAALTDVTWTCVASAGSDCAANGTGDINASVDLLINGTATFTLTGSVAPRATGTLVNTASVAVPAGVTDPNTNNDRATDSNTLTPQVDLALSKTNRATRLVPGTATTYTIVVTNAGPSAVTGATVTDTVPTALTDVTWTCTASVGSTCPARGLGDINASVNLLVGGSATFTLTATVLSSATGTLSNTASITPPAGVNDTDTSNNGATDTDTLTPQANVAVTKTNGATSAVPGGSVIYTIAATNAGPSAVTGATVSDTLPADLTGATWTCVASAGSTCAATGTGNINATVDLAVSGTATFTLTATIAATATGTLTNRVTIELPDGVSDPDTTDNSARDMDTLQSQADLAVTKTDNTASVVQAGMTTYTIVATNHGPSALVGAMVNDPLSAAFADFSWTCVATAGSDCPATGTGAIDAAVDLLPGGTATFTVLAEVSAAAGGLAVNQVTVTVPDRVQDPDGSNNAATDANTVIPAADVEVVKTVSNTTPNVGDTVTFTVTVSNRGPSDATGVQVSDGLSLGLTFVSATATPGTYTAATGVWDIGAIALGRTATLELQARVEQTTRLTNVATKIAGDQFDPDTSNNAGGVTLTGRPSADIQVLKQVDNALPSVGSTVTFTVRVTNTGPTDATRVEVTDTMPAGLTLVRATPTTGTYSVATGIWNVGSVSVGANENLELTATVDQPGSLSNIATKTAQGENDPVTSNDASGATINGQSADVQVVKTVDLTTPQVGDTVTFTVTVTNNGPSAATGVAVTDSVPNGFTLVNAIPSQGTYVPATGLWSIGPLASSGAGATVTLQLMATVNQASLLSNIAIRTAQNQPDPNPANDQGSVEVAAQPTADLQVTKENGATTVTQAGTTTYTIVVTNNGPSAVSGATVSDPLPAGLSDFTWTCTTSAGSSCPGSGSGALNTTVDLRSGGTATFTVLATVSPTATGIVNNTVTVSTPVGTLDAVTGNNVASDVDAVEPAADLVVTKSNGVTSVLQGDITTYNIVVTNRGPAPAIGAQVSDPLPVGVSDFTWTCAASPGSSCPASGTGGLDTTVDLLDDGTATFTVLATVRAAATGTLVNQATVAVPPGTVDPRPGNNTATDTDTVNSTADLALTKTDNATSVLAGGTTTYTLVVTNNGPAEVTDATVTDALPAGVRDFTWTCTASAGSNCPASGSGALNTTVDLRRGGTATFTVTASIRAAATGTIINQATVAVPVGTIDPVVGNNTATDTNIVSGTVTPIADLAVSKTNNTTTVPQGGNTTYTIVVTNNGPGPAIGATLTDPLPTGISAATWTCIASVGSSCASAGTGGLNTTVDLLNRGTATFTVVAQVSPTATASITNQVAVIVPAGLRDPMVSNNSAIDTDTVTPAADLAVTKSNGTTGVSQGGTTTYTIVVRNNGPAAVTGATVTDPLPSGLSTATWSCVASSGSSCAAAGTGGINTLVNLLSGGTATFTVVATVSSTATGNVANQVTVTLPAGIVDPLSGNNSAIDTDVVTSTADLQVTKNNGAGSVTPGSTTTYTIVVTNNGPGAALGATVSDPLPAGLGSATWTCVASIGSSCAAAGTGGMNTPVDLLNGGTATFTLLATVSATAAGNLTNRVTVTAPAGTVDPTPGNNRATDTDTVTPAADLAITKSNGATNVPQGGTTTYTLVVTNNGPVAVTGATVSDPLVAGISNATWTCVASPGSSCSAAGTGGINTPVDLLSGGTATFTMLATVSPTATGLLVNLATVAVPAGTLDLIPGNNSATDTDTVTPTADLAVSKSNGTTSVIPGGTTTYAIVVTNNGPSTVVGATVNDPLPAGISSATWTCVASPGSSCPAAGTGGINTPVVLLSEGTATFTVLATVSATATGNLTNQVTVAVPVGTLDPRPGNNRATDTDAVTPAADLAVRKNNGASSVAQGGTTTYTLVVTNNGPAAVVGATVSDPLPAGVNSATWNCVASTGSSCPASGTGEINAAVDLLNGGTATFTLLATVSPTATGNLVNQVTVTVPPALVDPTPGNNSAIDIDAVTPAADLMVSKSNGTASVLQGGLTTYTVVVTNNGPAAAVGTTVRDPLPTGLTAFDWTCTASTGSSCPALGTGAIDTTVALLAGGTATFTVTAAVDPAATGTITNQVSVTTPRGLTDPVAGNNTAEDTDSVAAAADLAVTKTDGIGRVTRGDTTTYTIVVTNNGPAAVVGATLSDPLPAGISGATWTCVASPGSVCPASGTDAIDAAVDLLSGGTAIFAMLASISSTATGTISNEVNVAVPAGIIDAVAVNNIATDVNVVRGTVSTVADLAVTKTHGTAGIVPGGTVTYTVVVTNNGPGPAVGATLRDPLPAGVTGFSWTCTASSGSACTTVGTGAIDTTVDLLNGGTATFTVVATVSTTATGTLANQVTVAAPRGVVDPVPTNNSVTDTDSVTPTADLAVTKSNGSFRVTQGGTTTYTIVVTNNGPGAVTDARVSDPLPAGLRGAAWTCVASAGSGCPAAGTGAINATVDLVNGGIATFTLVATVRATSTIANQVTVAAPAGTVDPVSVNNSATDTDTVTPTADLSVTKSNGVSSVLPGSTTTYNIVVTNNGPAAVTGATVSDPLPTGLSAATWTCVASAGSSCPTTGTGTINTAVSLGNGGMATFTVVATVSTTAIGTIANQVTVGVPAGTLDPTLTNNSATDTDTVTPTADLSVTKSNGVSNVLQGSITTYTIVVTNNGPTAVTGATVSDPLPAGLRGMTWTCTASAGSRCPAAGTGAINATVDLVNGGIATFTVVATVRATTGAIANQVTVTVPAGTVDPVSVNNSATDTDTVTPTADLSVTKSNGVSSVSPGSTTTYNIVVTNNGPAAVSGATVTDLLPAGVSAATWSCVASARSSCLPTGTGSINTAVNLVSGGTATFTVVATISATATGTLTNQVTVAVPTGIVDPTSTNNTATDTDAIGTVADLAVTKTDSTAAVVPGSTITYTIVVTNNGPAPVIGATVTDPLPTGISSWNWTCVTSPGSRCPASGSGAIHATIDLLAGSAASFTVVAVVNSTATGTIANQVSVAVPSSIVDPIDSNNTATDANPVTSTADIALTKQVDNATPNAGGLVTFTVTARNHGPSAATGLQVSDVLPAGLSVVQATPAQGTYDGSTGLWDIGALPVNASVTLALVANVQAGTGGTVLTNTAQVTAVDQTDPTSSNNTASIDITPQGADLVITKLGPGTVDRGATLTYTLTVRNLGPSQATQVTVTDPTPPGLNFVSAEAPCTGGFPCDLGTLAVGQSRAVVTQYEVPVTYAGPDPILNTASVASTVTDPVPANNNIRSATAVGRLPEVDLQITLTGPPSAAMGSTVTYTIVVTNNGPDDALPTVTVTYPLPPGLTFVSATGPCAAGFPCDLGPLNTGGSVTIQVTLAIPPDYTGPDPVVSTASVSTPTAETDLTNNTANVSTPLGANPADLELNKSGPVQVTSGHNVIYTLVVTNRGPGQATGVTLDDPIPAGLTLSSVGAPCQTGFPCPLRVLEANDSVTIPVTFIVPANYDGANPIVNTATVQGNEPDGNNANNSATVFTAVDSDLADLRVVEDGPASTELGETVTYTMVITNNGPGIATNVVLSDTAPAGLELVGVSVPCAAGLPCSLGDLAPGSSITVSVTFLVPAGYTGPNPFSHPVQVETTAADPDLSNNTATVETTVPLLPQADLALAKTAAPDPVQVGDTLTYTLTITNNGPDTATGVTLQDTLPAGITLQTTTPAAPVCTVAGVTVSCALGSVAPGSSTTVTLSGLVTAAQGLTNTASVSAQESDPNPGDNTVTVTPTGNTPPVANNDVTTTILDTPVVITVLGNDSDADGDTVQVVSVTQPPNGRVVINADGTVTYTPNPGFRGPDTFTYTISDGRGGTDTATVTVNFINVFDPPSGRKVVNTAGLPELEWKQVWINDGNVTALRTRISDTIPPEVTYVEDSLSCEGRGLSTVDRCVFEATTNRTIYEGDIAPDPNGTTEENSRNEVVIIFRTLVPPGVVRVENQAVANWDANGDGSIDDEVQGGQVAVLSSATVGQGDPTSTLLPGLACLFQQRALSVPGLAVPGLTGDGTDEQIDNPEDTGIDVIESLQVAGADGVFALTSPMAGDDIAGNAVALAALNVPFRGTSVSQSIVVNVDNGAAPQALDIVEQVGRKRETIVVNQEHIVVTAQGVIAELPATALAAQETLHIEVVAATASPAPLPGKAASALVRVTLASGQTVFRSPVRLRLPYPDANQDRIVDETNPAIQETELTVWFFDTTRQTWVHLPEARVFTALNIVLVPTAQTGLFGVFQAFDGRLGIVGTSGPAPQPPRSATAQGDGWQDIGVALRYPFLTSWNTTALANGNYELRVACAESVAALAAFRDSASGGPTGASSGGNSGGGGDCFIATAAFGSPLATQVQVLREFRDQYLLPHSVGRWLVRQYYRVSPSLATLIRKHEMLGTVTRVGLTPVVWTLHVWLHGTLVQQVLLGVGILLGGTGVGWGLYNRKRQWRR